MYSNVYLCIYIHTYIHSYIYIYNIFIYIYICIYIYIYIYIHTHTHTPVPPCAVILCSAVRYTHKCTHIYIYVYMNIYISYIHIYSPVPHLQSVCVCVRARFCAFWCVFSQEQIRGPTQYVCTSYWSHIICIHVHTGPISHEIYSHRSHICTIFLRVLERATLLAESDPSEEALDSASGVT